MENYEVIKEIGEGAFGVVSMARDKKTSNIVAIKRIKKKIQSSVLDKVLQRELKSLKKFDHKNIVKLYQSFKANGELHMVFEYVDSNLFKLYESRKQKVSTKVS